MRDLIRRSDKERSEKGFHFFSADKLRFAYNKSYFELADIDVHIHSGQGSLPRAVTTIKVEVDGQTEHTAAEAVGPKHAMDGALRASLNFHLYSSEVNQVPQLEEH